MGLFLLDYPMFADDLDKIDSGYKPRQNRLAISRWSVEDDYSDDYHEGAREVSQLEKSAMKAPAEANLYYWYDD